MNIYDTHFMLGAVREIPLEHTFFKNRYFPTNQSMDIFGTTRVLVDFAEDSQRIAPFVLPRVGAIPGVREGFATADLEPANICISMPLTVDQLTQRGFGESLMSNKTPAERSTNMLIHDLQELNARITRAEEKLAADTILNNGTVMRHLAGNGTYEDVGATFYGEEGNGALFTPTEDWDHSTYENGTWTPGGWYADICAMIADMVRSGRAVRELVVSEDVADFLMSDGWILAMLDNRRAEMGRLNPEELGPFAYQLGTFNFKGRMLPIIVNSGTYEEKDESGEYVDTPYLPEGTVIVIAPDVGRGLYGAVTIMGEDKNFQTIAGTRIPETIVTQRPAARETQMTARPLFVPKRKNAWRVATGIVLG